MLKILTVFHLMMVIVVISLKRHGQCSACTCNNYVFLLQVWNYMFDYEFELSFSLNFPKFRSLSALVCLLLGKIFSQVCYSVRYVCMFVCLIVCLFVCSHATGHIFHSIDLKLWGYTCIRKFSGGIVFRQNRIQDGGCGGHFVSEKLLKNSQKLHFSIKSIQNLYLSYPMYSTWNCEVSF